MKYLTLLVLINWGISSSSFAQKIEEITYVDYSKIAAAIKDSSYYGTLGRTEILLKEHGIKVMASYTRLFVYEQDHDTDMVYLKFSKTGIDEGFTILMMPRSTHIYYPSEYKLDQIKKYYYAFKAYFLQDPTNFSVLSDSIISHDTFEVLKSNLLLKNDSHVIGYSYLPGPNRQGMELDIKYDPVFDSSCSCKGIKEDRITIRSMKNVGQAPVGKEPKLPAFTVYVYRNRVQAIFFNMQAYRLIAEGRVKPLETFLTQILTTSVIH